VLHKLLSILLGIFTATSSTSPVTVRARLVELRDSQNPKIVYQRTLITDETYLETMNREAREKYPPRKNRRTFLFYGAASEHESRVGVKIRIPL